MEKQQNKTLVYFFLLSQTILTFVLGIFGNKIAEQINISGTSLLTGTIILIVILFVVSVRLLQNDTKKDGAVSPPKNQLGKVLETIGKLLLGRIATILPLATALGAVIAWISVKQLIPTAVNIQIVFSSLIKNQEMWEMPGPRNYEIVCFVVAVISLFTLYAYKSNFSLSISFAIGFANGVSGVLLFLDPTHNDIIATFIGWNIIMVIAAAMVRYQGLRDSIRKVVNSIIQER